MNNIKMANLFQLNKKYGEWAERTVFIFFKNNKNKTGLDIFYFGSQRDTREKDTTDAPNRPDFIVLKNKIVKKLQKKHKLNFNKPNLRSLFSKVYISDKDKKILSQKPYLWMTKILDKEGITRDIVRNTHCLLEIKSGFGIFNEKKYKAEKLNIMLPLDFEKKVIKIQSKFKVNFNTYAIYVLLDRAYIANMNKIYSREGGITEYSYNRIGKSEVAKSLYRTLLFNKSYFFADIEGIVYGDKKKPKLRARPLIIIINGAINFSLKMTPGKLKNVNIEIIKKLKD